MKKTVTIDEFTNTMPEDLNDLITWVESIKRAAEEQRITDVRVLVDFDDGDMYVRVRGIREETEEERQTRVESEEARARTLEAEERAKLRELKRKYENAS